MPKWPKGTSGNPGGRPRGLANSVKQKYGVRAFRAILDIMEGRLEELAVDKEGQRYSVAPSVKEVREAAKIVLAYTWGTPVSVDADALERRVDELERELLATKERPWVHSNGVSSD